MTRLPVKSATIFGLLFLVAACHHANAPLQRAFFYNNSRFILNEQERRLLKDANITRLYINFFTVSWEEKNHRPWPTSPVHIDSASLRWIFQSNIEVVPVVFLSNECLEHIAENKVGAMAERINFLVQAVLKRDISRNKSILIDCDWNEDTRDKYFATLRYLEMLPFFLGKRIYVGVRLNQCANPEAFGTPPATAGTLMTFSDSLPAVENPDFPRYPLPLDLVVPFHNCPVIIRKGSRGPAITNLADSVWQHSAIATLTKGRYIISNDTTLGDYYLKAGDQIAVQHANGRDLISSVQTYGRAVGAPDSTLILFQLDSTVATQNDTAKLNGIFDRFKR